MVMARVVEEEEEEEEEGGGTRWWMIRCLCGSMCRRL